MNRDVAAPAFSIGKSKKGKSTFHFCFPEK